MYAKVKIIVLCGKFTNATTKIEKLIIQKINAPISKKISKKFPRQIIPKNFIPIGKLIAADEIATKL